MSPPTIRNQAIAQSGHQTSDVLPVRTRFGNLAEVALQFGFTLVGRGSYLALQVILARMLGPEGFGLYAIGWTVAGLTNTLAPIGMPQAILRYGIGGRSAMISRPAIVATLAGLACMVLLLLAPGLIATRVFGEPAAIPIIRAFAPSVPLFCLAGVVWSALRVSGRILSYSITGAAIFVVHLVLTALLFMMRPSPILAAEAYTLAIGLTLLVTIPLLWRSPSLLSQRSTTRQIMHFGVVTMLISGSSVLNIWADRVVIGIMAAPAVLAAYQVASQFAMIMVVLRSAVTSVFENRVPKHRIGAAVPDVTVDFIAATRLMLHVSAPGLVVLACSSGFWVHLLFGAAYASAATPLVILVIGQIAFTLFGPTPTALHMTGAERFVMVVMISAAILNIAGNVALIPFLGATGAALATGVANMVISLTCLFRLVQTKRLHFSFAWLRDILAATLTCTIFTMMIIRFGGGFSILSALGTVVTSYAVYVLCICRTCTVEDELVGLVRSTLHRRFPKLASL